MSNYMKKGSILIESYKRVRNEQYAARTRLKNAKDELSGSDLKELEEIIYFPFDTVIDKLELEIKYLCEGYIPIYPDFLAKIDGINIYEALELVVLLKDIRRFRTVSALWKYSGFAPVQYCARCKKRYFNNIIERKEFMDKYYKETRSFYSDCDCEEPRPYYASEKRIRGVSPDYNEALKKVLVSIADKVIKADDYYRGKFFYYRTFEAQKNEKLTELHINNRAKRKVIKLFLYHLFNEWRVLEGLEPEKAYINLPNYGE